MFKLIFQLYNTIEGLTFMAKVIYMCEKIRRRNKSDFDEKKLDIEPDWESIIERGF